MITFIIGAMPVEGQWIRDVVNTYEKDERTIIACDRGYFNTNMAGIIPDVVIGDFDSAGEVLYEHLMRENKNVIKLNPIKDDTDIEAALRYSFENTEGDIVILGALGGRIDHTLGNIALLGLGLEHGRDVYLQNAVNRVQMIPPNGELVLKKAEQYGKYVSVFPYMSEVTGLTMAGFKYPLEQATIKGFNTLTVSNEIEADIAYIRHQDGYLLVCETVDGN
ncbi:MAG: thiamine diphosphokinase [Pseudobutyrivibrio sp.]|nr:thiamine diphosphokinase [Pseudobutyrivibrio sp.]